MSEDHLNALAVAAHVDDIELSCGGTLIKLAKRGHSVGTCELTEGELSTRGNPEIRRREAEQAGRIMGLAVRENLGVPDGDIVNNYANRLKLISVLRKYRPQYVFANYWVDRHPDHASGSRLVTDACFYSGLRRINTDQEPFRPRMIFYYQLRDELEPSFLVDISEEFETKMAAIAAHRSQFFDPESSEPETFISSSYFMEALVKRMEYYGLRIGARYAEPFFIRQYIGIDDPLEFFNAVDTNRIMSTPPSGR
jgi:bacillithiol biosynthesis deacetylase BshB1